MFICSVPNICLEQNSVKLKVLLSVKSLFTSSGLGRKYMIIKIMMTCFSRRVVQSRINLKKTILTWLSSFFSCTLWNHLLIPSLTLYCGTRLLNWSLCSIQDHHAWPVLVVLPCVMSHSSPAAFLTDLWSKTCIFTIFCLPLRGKNRRYWAHSRCSSQG